MYLFSWLYTEIDIWIEAGGATSELRLVVGWRLNKYESSAFLWQMLHHLPTQQHPKLPAHFKLVSVCVHWAQSESVRMLILMESIFFFRVEAPARLLSSFNEAKWRTEMLQGKGEDWEQLRAGIDEMRGMPIHAAESKTHKPAWLEPRQDQSSTEQMTIHKPLRKDRVDSRF